jgi:hypothetical protein
MKKIKKFEEFQVNERLKLDVEFILKEIVRFNNDEFDINELSKRILKHFRYSVNPKNIEIVSDHLLMSADEDTDKIPVDKDLFYELIDLL